MELTDQETLDIFTANVMKGLLSSFAWGALLSVPSPEDAAKEAYDRARAMMAERARRDERGVVTEDAGA